MTSQVVEIARFKLRQGTSDEDFRAAAAAVSQFLSEQPGFIARTLSQGDSGDCIDHVVWANLADAQSAMQRAMQDQRLAAFMAAIDETSLQMEHRALVVSTP
jgi:heme-degrading monooxygenase HmoA